MNTAGCDSDESEPQHGLPPVLDYSQPRVKGPRKTPSYLRSLLAVVSMFAILFAIPFCAGGINMIWNWLSGTVTADRADGLRFLAVGGLLLITGLFGARAAFRSRSKA
jgi:hypothetical protein